MQQKSATYFAPRLPPVFIDSAILVAITLIYVVFRTHTYYWDGVSFALAIESVYQGQSPFFVLFHPNHLIYNVLGYALYSFALHLGLSVRASVGSSAERNQYP